MKKYVRISLETHLFFCRIMKEHALFLLAGFPAGEERFRNRVEWFRAELERALERAVQLANGVVGRCILESGEIVTEFTEMAERQTKRLTGIAIDERITQAEKRLQAGYVENPSGELVRSVRSLNRRMIELLNGLISFKETILCEVNGCSLYTSNYPLLIEHILREAKLYRRIMAEIEQKGCMLSMDIRSTELFWNQIMMEHAQFIRGLLDPTECELAETADSFAEEYCRLLEKAREEDCRAMDERMKKSWIRKRASAECTRPKSLQGIFSAVQPEA